MRCSVSSLGLALIGSLVLTMPVSTVRGESRSEPTAVELRVAFDRADGERAEIDLIVLAGQGARLEDPTRGVAVRLVPHLQRFSGGPSAVARIGLEVQEVLRLDALGKTYSTVDLAPLDVGGSTSLFHGSWLMEVTFVAVLEPEDMPRLVQPYGLRPVECCVGCEGYLYCGHCVSTACGSCCGR